MQCDNLEVIGDDDAALSTAPLTPVVAANFVLTALRVSIITV